MTAWQEHRGLIIFGIIAIIVLTGALIAFKITGPMGIEERFNTAVGLHGEKGALQEESSSGFSLEGHPFLYLVFIAILVIAGFLLYRKYRI